MWLRVIHYKELRPFGIFRLDLENKWSTEFDALLDDTGRYGNWKKDTNTNILTQQFWITCTERPQNNTDHYKIKRYPIYVLLVSQTSNFHSASHYTQPVSSYRAL